jgi:hypothetical protein
MNPLRIAVVVLGLALLGVIAWAILGGGEIHGSFGQQVAVVTTLPWGVVTLFDLYIGFVFFAVIILLTERSWIAAALWAAPLLVLGNVWAAVWLALRLPRLIDRLARSD